MTCLRLRSEGYGATQALAYGVPALAGALLSGGITAAVSKKNKAKRAVAAAAILGAAAGGGLAGLNADSNLASDQ